MKQVFDLPHRDWLACKQRLDWCRDNLGPRELGGVWEYHAVSHHVVITGEGNIVLYKLRWS
jgi:hypothetical protein